MKRGPTCAEIYADETLRFCRTDGALLTVFDTEAPTAEFGSVAATAAKTIRETPRRRPSKSKAIDSIAILPFDNASADSNAEYLSDGITENIINNLSQLPRLKVMARSTVFRYKGERVDPQRVADELGVRAVVTGRVQQLGDRLKIGIELVDAADGSQLWGERYVRQMADVFELQDEISEQISTRLKLTLTSSRRKRPVKRHTKRREVYDLYLRGRFFWNKRTEADAHRGIECFRQALAIDPNFALAYGGLADCQTLLGDVGLQATPPKEAFLQGHESAARALALDDSLAEAHGTMGHLSMHLFDWPRAESELLRALELSPNYAQAWIWYAYYLAFTGKPDESIQTVKRALEVDPLSLPANTSAGELFHFAERREESIEQYQKALELNPQHTVAHLGLGRVYERARMVAEAFASFGKARELSHDSPESLASVAHCYSASGQSDEARGLLTKLNELKKMRYVSSYDLALVHAGLGESDEAFKWLNRGCEIHDGWMIYITVDPRWEQLHPDDRFRGVVGRVGLSV
jgi:TolB-like protein/tetratricopeptide (TPR) repeat protein